MSGQFVAEENTGIVCLTRSMPVVGSTINTNVRVENQYASPSRYTEAPLAIRLSPLSGMFYQYSRVLVRAIKNLCTDGNK